jgi:hypothetical protein
VAKQAKNSKVKQKNMRTQEEIKRQIEGLEKMKTWLPEYSGLGTPNHELIDVQISIIDGSSELSDIDEGDFEEMDAQNQVHRGAEEAEMWLDGDREEDLFEEQS